MRLDFALSRIKAYFFAFFRFSKLVLRLLWQIILPIIVKVAL
jgi:hypothetical protein